MYSSKTPQGHISDPQTKTLLLGERDFKMETETSQDFKLDLWTARLQLLHFRTESACSVAPGRCNMRRGFIDLTES